MIQYICQNQIESGLYAIGGIDMKTDLKKKCNCPCHSSAGAMMHCFPCCDAGVELLRDVEVFVIVKDGMGIYTQLNLQDDDMLKVIDTINNAAPFEKMILGRDRK